MGQGKQAKIFNAKQEAAVLRHLETTRYPAQQEGCCTEPPNSLNTLPCLACVQKVHFLHATFRAFEILSQLTQPVQKLQQKTKGKKYRAFLGCCTP